MHKLTEDFSSDKYLLVGDLHITLETLNLSERVLNKAYEKCKELNVPMLIAGDFFHTKAIMRSECLNLALKYLRREDWKVIMIVGNHDYENKDCKGHSLECFNDLPNVLVIDQTDWLNKGKMLLISYCSDEIFKQRTESTEAEVIICHHGISGFLMNNVKKSEGEVKQKDLKHIKKVYCGHWHLPQERGNIVYIGSPYQQNFGETQQLKRFLLLDINKCSHEEILLPDFPKYHIFSLTTEQVLSRTHTLGIPINTEDHIRLDISGPKDQHRKINKALIRSKYKLDCDIRINPKFIDSVDTEITIQDTLNFTNMYSHWLNLQNTGLDKKVLLKKGEGLIDAYL